MISLVVAGVLAIAGHPAELTTDATWQEAATPAADDGPVLVLRTDAGGLLAVTVAMAPNADAWRAAKRAAYEQEIIAGFAAEGVTVKKATPTLVQKVPCIDLMLVRDGKPVAVRLLLFRTRTVAVAVEGVAAAAGMDAARGLMPTHETDPAR